MPEGRKHKAFLNFVSRLTGVAASYPESDLQEFLRIARVDMPGLSKVISAYIDLAGRSQSEVAATSTREKDSKSSKAPMHLFDLLRSKKLFVTNSELADFAARVLPDMSRKRFDKMSRADIAARIIEWLETLDAGTRRKLEASMRSALGIGSRERRSAKRSFFTEWEQIIKGMKL